MTIDRNYFDNSEWNGKKMYEFKQVGNNIGSYECHGGYQTVFFELDTNEKIGVICESDNRTNWKSYYNASCLFGWDGKRNTKKDFCKKLCTKADYSVAYSLLMEEYKNRKQ